MATNVFGQKKRSFDPEPGVMDMLKDWPDPNAEKVATPAPAADLPLAAASLLKTNALYKTKPEPGMRYSHKPDEVIEVKPLTADDIEQIRQAAFDEGISQGKEEGFSKGYQDGREQGYQDGQQQGLAEGKKAGLLEGEALIREQLAQLQQLLTQLQQPLLQLNAEVEQSLLDLTVQMAQAVIGVEVRSNPQAILQTLMEAVEALPTQADKLLIKLHPDDLAVVKMHFTEADILERHWQLRGEPSLERGDCRIESSGSSVDRRLKLRLQSNLEHFFQEPVQQPAEPSPDATDH